MKQREGFLGELQRRNVIRMAGLYIAASWLVVEVAGTVLPMFDAPGWVGRSLVVLVAIGFLPALLFAWVFELTPQGLKREGEVPAEQSVTRKTARHLDRAVVALLVLVVGYVAVDKLVLAPRREATLVAVAEAHAVAQTPAIADKSIAVLPFRNDGGDADDQYFSDGLSEDLITELSKFDGLKVIARDSAFRFRDSSQDSKAIGTQLGVAHLLSGSVRRLGDVVRISATLVRASDGRSLWAQRYDRPYQDLFALQDDITRAVSGALQTRLLAASAAAGQSDRPAGGNLEAYEAVLKGNFHYAQRTEAASRLAIEAFTQAVALDPMYAYAHARLAQARIRLMSNFPGLTKDDVLLSGQAIATALRLDPQSAEAYKARAVLLSLQLDIPGARRAAERALALAPGDADALNIATRTQLILGDFERALDGFRRAVALDPLSEGARFNLALALMANGQPAEAEIAMRQIIAQRPGGAQGHAYLAVIELLQGRAAEALATARQEPDPFWRTWALALAYWGTGDRAKSDAALQQLIRENADDAGSQIAQIYAQRRQPDEMFKWLAHARATGDPGIRELRYTDFINDYHDDPRFVTFARELGLMADAPASAGSPGGSGN